MRWLVLLSALLVFLVSACSSDNVVLLFENDTERVITIYGVGGHEAPDVLQPGEVLDVLAPAKPGNDEFAGNADGRPFRFIINTGEIEEYREPGTRQYRLPLSELIGAR